MKILNLKTFHLVSMFPYLKSMLIVIYILIVTDVQDLTIKIASKKPGNIVKFIIMDEYRKNVEINSMLDKSMWQMHDVLITKNDKIYRDFSYGKRNSNECFLPSISIFLF
jgi:hypothetical protein